MLNDGPGADAHGPNQGAIGVLDKTQMDHFASIFLAYQKRGKAEDEEGTVYLFCRE